MTQEETASLERRLAEATRELAELEERIGMLMEAVPFGVAIIQPNGHTDANAVATRMFGPTETQLEAQSEDWQHMYRFFRADRSTPVLPHELPGVRALYGETACGSFLPMAPTGSCSPSQRSRFPAGTRLRLSVISRRGRDSKRSSTSGARRWRSAMRRIAR